MNYTNYQNQANTCCDTNCQDTSFGHHHKYAQNPSTRTTPLNVQKSEAQYELSLNFVGFAKQDIKIDFHEQVMTVTAQRDAAAHTTADKVLHREFKIKNSTRKIAIPSDVTIDEISATYADGILSIKMPRKVKETIKVNIL